VYANRGAGGLCDSRYRSPCRQLVNPSVTNTRPYCRLVDGSNTKYGCQVAGRGTTDQTRWSTLNGCHVDESDILEAVHKVDRDPVFSSATAAKRFTGDQYYADVPALPPRFHRHICYLWCGVSVRPFVTRRYCAKFAKRRIIETAWFGSVKISERDCIHKFSFL